MQLFNFKSNKSLCHRRTWNPKKIREQLKEGAKNIVKTWYSIHLYSNSTYLIHCQHFVLKPKDGGCHACKNVYFFFKQPFIRIINKILNS